MAEYIHDDLLSDKHRKLSGKMSTIKCPSCKAKVSMLRVSSSLEDSSTLECDNCGYTTHLPTSNVKLASK